MKAKVLVIEDDEELCSLVSAAFRIENFETYSATSVEKALEILKKNRIDLVFADIVLNDKKSTDYAEKFLESNENLQLILTSAHYELVKKENSYKNPRLTAIPKPYDIEKVIQTARSILIKK